MHNVTDVTHQHFLSCQRQQDVEKKSPGGILNTSHFAIVDVIFPLQCLCVLYLTKKKAWNKSKYWRAVQKLGLFLSLPP